MTAQMERGRVLDTPDLVKSENKTSTAMIGTAASEGNPARYTEVHSSIPVGKRIELMADGTVSKKAQGEVRDGIAVQRDVQTLHEFDHRVRELTAHDAIIFTTSLHGRAALVTKAELTSSLIRKRIAAGDAIVARDLANFSDRSGPVIIQLDHDPQPGCAPLTLDEVYERAVRCVPGFGSATALGRRSAASGVFDSNSGAEVPGGNGLRHYQILEDGAERSAIGQRIVDYTILGGEGYVRHSENGAMHIRSLFDASVYQPNHWEFVAADCVGDLFQVRKPGRYFGPGAEGGPESEVRLAADAIPPLTEGQRLQLVEMKRLMRADPAALAESTRLRNAWALKRAEKALPGKPADEIRERACVIAAAALRGRLHVTDWVTLDDDTTVQLSDVLADRARYHERRGYDPLEGGDDQRVMVIYTDGFDVILHSHLHGGYVCTVSDDGFEDVSEEELARPAATLLGTEPAKAQREGEEGREREFVFISPENLFMHRPTKGLWTANAVDKHVGTLPGTEAVKRKVRREGVVTIETDFVETDVPASRVIARRSWAGQMGWLPGHPEIVEGAVMTEGGLAHVQGQRVYNLYREPPKLSGDASKAGVWVEHVQRIIPDHAEHFFDWAAHTLQHVAVKINHGIVLGGAQGIGKDTALAPIRAGLGRWNCGDIHPSVVVGRFNGHVKNKLLVISEARDSGETSRHALYEATKTMLAAPPEVIRVDEKNLREHHVINVLSVVITTNHRTDGLYLPADDRRHYVAWSEAKAEDFDDGYWRHLHGWLESGGAEHAATWLLARDISHFNPKAPPPKTRDFWLIVQSNEAPENAEFRDLIEGLDDRSAFTISDLIAVASRLDAHDSITTLTDKGQRRSLGHKLGRVGYGPVRNQSAKDGHWVIDGMRQVIYCDVQASLSDQIRACVARQARGAPRSTNAGADALDFA